MKTSEIAIKVSIGKYQIPGNFETWIEHQIQVNELEILPIKVAHVAAIVTLPFHHKDPFDRLLVAQALTEKIPIISVDAVARQLSSHSLLVSIRTCDQPQWDRTVNVPYNHGPRFTSSTFLSRRAIDSYQFSKQRFFSRNCLMNPGG